MHHRVGRPIGIVVLLIGLAAAYCCADHQKNFAGILRCGLPGESGELIEALSQEIAAAGFNVAEINLDAMAGLDTSKGRPFDLLVLPDGAHLPTSLAPAIERYARAGGKIIALQTPLWPEPMIKTEAGWVDRRTWQTSHAGQQPPHVLFRFEPADMRDWQIARTPNDGESTHETVAVGPAPGTRSLHVVGKRLAGFDSHYPKAIDKPFPAGHTLTIFSARGAAGTDQMMVEWEETDGSRWIAVVDLEPQWRQYVLFPEDFHYWQSVGGRATDRFHPGSARSIRFAVAASHTPNLAGKPYEYWVGPVGTAQSDPTYEQLRCAAGLPVMDTLSPAYKFFDCHDVARLATRKDQSIVSAAEFNVPAIVRSPHPRARGAGFDKGRTWRWIPLIEAQTDKGVWRGVPATLMLHADGPFKGSAWASFGIEGPECYLRAEGRRMIRELASRLRTGAFILDAGADRFTCYEDQSMRLGLQVFALKGVPSPASLSARVTVVHRDTSKTAFAHSWPIKIDSPAVAKVETTWKPASWPAAGFDCTAELLADGRPIDSVVHEIHVWRPRSDKHYITVADGQFMLDGARWRANGVNYMPTSGTSHESYTYFREYLSAASYDPEVIARDLANVRSMGFNAISIFLLHQNTRDQNLLDLLRQADGAGLKVNLAVLPATPMDFQADKVREMIAYYRLPEHDEVFALDVDWEPMFGPQASRARWDKEWEAWLAERYGSVEAAERDWLFKAPRTPAGTITNPTIEQSDTDGPWRAMVAAYRRFLDTLLYQKYGPARDFIRTLDPHHLVSFRMAYAGDPTYRNYGWMTYDFPYLAAVVDFLGPEGYGRLGDWERVKPGWFEVCYARWADPGKPVVWAEAGVSAWDASRMCSTPAALQFQADFYEHFYKMMIASASDGVFWWYYPGGYRNEERSDFGIINPDGSDRPVTRIIRKYGPKFLAGPPAKPPDTWIAVDRDAHSAGVSGIYESVQRQFWQAIDAGHTPGLKTTGTGTDSGNCPALAVGNVPLTGANPPKYLDTAFDRVEIRDSTGQFVTVAKGGQVKVRSDQPVVARIALRNLGEAAWLPGTPAGTGAVCLIVDGTQAAPVPIPQRVEHLQTIALDNLTLTPAGLKQPTRITLSLKAENRSPFGERFSITLVP